MGSPCWGAPQQGLMAPNSSEISRRQVTVPEENPAQTGRELLERIQSAFPGRYPDALLRTVQRRIKGWRAEIAWALVFGSSETMSADGAAADALRNGEAPRVSGHPILTESID